MNRACKRRLKAAPGAAFTLLEVIVAMGIVTMLVLMIANMFQEVSRSWNVGMQSAEMNTSGRAAADFIARELAQAVAGPIEAAKLGSLSAITFKLENNELTFVAMSGDPKIGRALRGVTFRKDNDTLEYGQHTASFDPYSESPHPSGLGLAVLVANVQDFQVWAYASTGGTALAAYDSTAYSNRLPVYVDIYLELLGGDDAKKAVSAPDQADFIDRNARYYATRVYFNNRMGYGGRQ